MSETMANQEYGLGRVVEHDEQSRNYEVVRTARTPMLVLWRRYGAILNQGSLGACTGYAMTGWLQCAPHCTGPDQAARYTSETALALYSLATQLDNVTGVYPPDDTGSSGLAVAKAARRLKCISGYRWAFSWSGLMHALQAAPVIVGVPWFESMFTPDADGFVSAEGAVVGGHEFLIRGSAMGRDGQTILVADNSWGPDWGRNGSFYLTAATWKILAANRADVTAPIA